MNIDLRLGDCLDILKTIPDNSVDSVVTDSPYGLSFMGKKWDYDVPSVDIWVECLRVLKPGGHLLSFAGSRTYHRMAVRIEDAGFEIRDQIMWVYGSGFPKSHNIGKAIDKIEGNEREVVGDNPNHRKLQDTNTMVGEPHSGDGTITKGNSEWEGWGTALKPAHEPIVMARKPLSEKTIAENVLKHGTGGINIDGSRISHNEPIKVMKAQEGGNKVFGQGGRYEETTELKPEGRFPANIIFDEEAGQLLDEQSGISKSQGGNSGVLNNKIYGNFKGEKNNNGTGFNDKGGASRFFYCPKAAKKDRDEGMDGFEDKLSEIAQINSQTKLQPNGEYVENITLPRKNIHPTVKPTDLMRYLINLVTPPNGTTLDPFMGSGSTGKAAVRCGVNFIGIEREQEYMDIASARINHELNKEENAKK
jgi:site-specific DNA-methyltransferase (adenine-specific)